MLKCTLNYFRSKPATQCARGKLVDIENRRPEVGPTIILFVVVVKTLGIREWSSRGPTFPHEIGRWQQITYRGWHNHRRPLRRRRRFDKRPLRVAQSEREERGAKIGDQGEGECGKSTGWMPKHANCIDLLSLIVLFHTPFFPNISIMVPLQPPKVMQEALKGRPKSSRRRNKSR